MDRNLSRSNHYLYAMALVLIATAASAQTVSSSGDPPVAFIDGKPVLASELAQASQGQVLNLRKQEYDIKRRALDALLEQKLLEAEAAQSSMTVAQLQKDLDSKVGEPTESETEAFFLARQEQGRRFEDVRDQMRSLLKGAKRTAARDSFVSALRQRHTVDVMFDSPRVNVAADPARLKGAIDAPVQIVEFSDFECPFCRRAEPTIQALLAKYQGKVSLAYRDFPLNAIHPSASGRPKRPVAPRNRASSGPITNGFSRASRSIRKPSTNTPRMPGSIRRHSCTVSRRDASAMPWTETHSRDVLPASLARQRFS